MKWPLRFGRPPAIASAAALGEFLTRESAYLAQKTATDYCQAKAGLNWQKLFSEPDFQAALNVCRWESFAGVLADATLLAEGRLREVDESPRLAESMLALHEAVLRAHPPPAHLAEGWAPELANFSGRLARARLARPLPAAKLAETAARRLFDSLPIHPELRRLDFEMVANAVRFGLVSMSQTLDRRLDRAATARDLCAS
jgi:hypothetical protein